MVNFECYRCFVTATVFSPVVVFYLTVEFLLTVYCWAMQIELEATFYDFIFHLNFRHLLKTESGHPQKFKSFSEDWVIHQSVGQSREFGVPVSLPFG